MVPDLSSSSISQRIPDRSSDRRRRRSWFRRITLACLAAFTAAAYSTSSPVDGAYPSSPLRKLPSEIVVRAVETSYRLDDPKQQLRSLENKYRFVVDEGYFFMSHEGEGWDPDNSTVTDARVQVVESSDEAISVFSHPERPADQVANLASVVEVGTDGGFWRESPVPLVTLLLYAPSLLPESHLLAPSQIVADGDERSSASDGIVNYRTATLAATMTMDKEGRPLRIAAFLQSDASLLYEVDFEYSRQADGAVLPRWTHRFFASGTLVSETKAEALSQAGAPSVLPTVEIPKETLIRNSIERTRADPVNYWKDATGKVTRLSDEDLLRYSPMRPDQWPRPPSRYGYAWILAAALLVGAAGVVAASVLRHRRRR